MSQPTLQSQDLDILQGIVHQNHKQLFCVCDFTQITSLYQLLRQCIKHSVQMKQLRLSVVSQPVINAVICPLTVAIQHLSRMND